jgi:hypothetical protein
LFFEHICPDASARGGYSSVLRTCCLWRAEQIVVSHILLFHVLCCEMWCLMMSAMHYAFRTSKGMHLAQEISILCLITNAGGRNKRKNNISYFTFVLLFKLLLN